MSRLAALLLLLSLPAQAAITTKVLIGTSPTALPVLRSRRTMEVQNLGPDPIFCAASQAGALVNQARRIAANGGTWSIPAGDAFWCVAAAAQTGCDAESTSCTIITEVP